MTNEELAICVKNGERDRIEELWGQVTFFIKKQAIKRLGADVSRNGCTVDDLVQSGYPVPLKAIDYYDPENEKGGGFLKALMFFLPNAFSKALGQNAQGRDSVLDQAASLDAPIKESSSPDGTNATFGDFIEDENSAVPFLRVEDELTHEALCDLLYPILDGLTAPQQEVLYARYWLNMTYAEIGLQYGISRQRVNQIEQSAIEALRRHPRIHALKAFSCL